MSTSERELTATTAKKRGWASILWLPAALILALSAGGLTGILGAYYVNNSRAAAEVSALAGYRPSTVTKVYADDGETVIAEFALQKRIPLEEKDIPKHIEHAILAIEDARFYEHNGIDPWRIGGALYYRVTRGSVEGGSTITQQIAKNLFLTKAQTLDRKANEWLMALQIERFYTKRQILEMYVNNFFLGAGSYGFEAASRTYFNKPSKDLTIEEAALLAAIPKAPSDYAPTVNMQKALERRNLVLHEMAEHKFISENDYQTAKAKPIVLAETAFYQSQARSSAMDYPIEEIRKYLEEEYTTRVAQGGLEVYTTINIEAQELAQKIVREKLRAYDRGRGEWRSEYKLIKETGEPSDKELKAFKHPDWVGDEYDKGEYVKGLVMKIDPAKNEAQVRFGKYTAVVTQKEMTRAGKRALKDEFKLGTLAEFEIKEVNEAAKTLKVDLSQVPEVQAAMVTINAKTGEIPVMIGGYDFQTNKFNNATQGLRQTGSCYKPYVYTAAVEWGMTPESPVSGAAIKKWGWSPQNYDGSHSHGNVPMKTALAKSYNIAAVHLLDQVGVQTGAQMVRRFGITEPMQPFLPSALGASEASLLEMTSAYSTFPNKGVRVKPHLIRKVLDRDGNILEQWDKTTFKVTSEYVAGTMVEMMRAVTQGGGTATGANAGGHPVAGKTGTVNDHTDVWFIGYTPTYTTGVWMGNPLRKESLGSGMTGGKGAVPYFTSFMNQFMKGKPMESFYKTPAMPKDIQALKDQRQREENEKMLEMETLGDYKPTRIGGNGVKRTKTTPEGLIVDGNDPESGDTTIKQDQVTQPKSVDEKKDEPTVKTPPVTQKPAATTNLPAPKKNDADSANDPRPRVVEPPKKKGKKGDDDN